MSINEILTNIGMTKYRLAKLAEIPNATLSELCSGKTSIEKCSGETLYKIAKVLNISIESLLDDRMTLLARERSYEYDLPPYLQHDLDIFKEAISKNSTLIDCYWGELYGSINMAEHSDGAITAEHAEYLRQKYLWR